MKPCGHDPRLRIKGCLECMVERGELPGWTAPTRIVRIRPNRWVVLIAALIAFLSLVMDLLTMVDRGVAVVHGAVATSVGSTTYRTNVIAAPPVLPAGTTPAPSGYPTTPAATGGNVCPGGAQSSLLNSPYSTVGSPLGTTTSAVNVNGGVPGNISAVTLNTPNTTYYFAPGTWNLGTTQFAQIIMGTNDWYVGETGGSILTGQFDQQYGFVSPAGAVSSATADHVEYMTVEQFTTYGVGQGVTSGASGYLDLMYDTLTLNAPGSGANLGTGDIVEFNCMTKNGDYGANDYCVGTGCNPSALTDGPQQITLENNEISFNNQCNYEAVSTTFFPITPPASCAAAVTYFQCGCAGGMKFWMEDGVKVIGNYVHDNYDPGLWWDTDDNAEYIYGNYFSGNFGSAVDIEIAYNAWIQNNNFTDNGWGEGNCGTPCGVSANLVPAIYDSEAGGVASVVGQAAWPTGTAISTFTITGNLFKDNWDGIMSFLSADRFCGAPANTSINNCTMGAGHTTLWNFLTGTNPGLTSPGTTYYADIGVQTGHGCYDSGADGVLNGTTAVTSTNGFFDQANNAAVTAPTAGLFAFDCTTPSNIPVGDKIASCASAHACTLTAPANVSATGRVMVATVGDGCGQNTLTGATPSGSPNYFYNCYWPVSNLNVTGNIFQFNAANLPASCAANSSGSPCGMNGIWQGFGSLAWSPYLTFNPYSMWDVMDNCTTGNTFTGCVPANNSYTANTYTHTGPVNWQFLYRDQGTYLSPATWQANGWDAGSTFS